jgi:hypothetical protein
MALARLALDIDQGREAVDFFFLASPFIEL